MWSSESADDFAARSLRWIGSGAVRVDGNARVHLGSIDLSSPAPIGGGIGFGVPEVKFSAEIRASGSRVESGHLPSGLRELPVLAERANIDLSGLSVALTSRLPEHRGLGSTTQYLIGVLQGCLAVLGRPLLSVGELARIGIGAESSLGVRLAFNGQPLLDLGADTNEAGTLMFNSRQPRPKALRLNLPHAWRALVAWPAEVGGLDEGADEAFWHSVLPVSDSRTQEALSSILMEVLPSVLDRCFGTFMQGMARFNQASSKPEEWSIQPECVKLKAGLLSELGFVPLLSSVGPALVVFGPSLDSLRPAAAAFEPRKYEDKWEHVITGFERCVLA